MDDFTLSVQMQSRKRLHIRLYSDNHLVNKHLHAKSVFGSFRTTKIHVFLESVYARATSTRAEYIEIYYMIFTNYVLIKIRCFG